MAIPDKTSSSARFYRLGLVLMILGATLLGAFGVRQYRESSLGHTYYEFIIGAVVLAAVGLIIVQRSKRG